MSTLGVLNGSQPALVAFGWGVTSVLLAVGLVPAVRSWGRHLARRDSIRAHRHHLAELRRACERRP